MISLTEESRKQIKLILEKASYEDYIKAFEAVKNSLEIADRLSKSEEKTYEGLYRYTQELLDSYIEYQEAMIKHWLK
jgi:hypothetical protein